jgi:hypothetical protein
MLKSNISRTGRDELAAAIANLHQLDRTALGAHWRTLYGSAAPRRLAKPLLIGAVAYGLQERALGGLAASTRRRLGVAAAEKHIKPAPVRRTLTAGTTLLREWHGEHHQVTVLEDTGVEYRGQRYRSLSEVARQITGCRWSGPRFFGCRQARPE